MDVLKAIMTRRSVRQFTGQVIGEEELETILKAGFQAPSAHNFQPWHFIVLKDKEILEEIAIIHPYAKMLPNAGCGIVVCGEMKQDTEGFIVEDCSAAIENMLLAIHGMGLGAVWCGIHPVEDLKASFTTLLDLPDHILPVGMIAVGFKAEEKEFIDRYEQRKIHYDKW